VSSSFDPAALKSNYDIGSDDISYIYRDNKNLAVIHTSEEKAAKLRNAPNVLGMAVQNWDKGYNYGTSTIFPQYLPIFPNHPEYDWTEDNFGPLYIPQQGSTVTLTAKNLPLYRRAIEVYEGNELTVTEEGIKINGTLSNNYTFKLNYYWLMGDNRHNSVDSRYWGFVPEDHVIGKPVLVWFSKDPEGGIRWDRAFSLPE